MKSLKEIAEVLVFLSKKLKKKQEYRYVEMIDEEKEVYIGVTCELLTKNEFESEYMREKDVF